jgi:hypothetical protein
LAEVPRRKGAAPSPAHELAGNKKKNSAWFPGLAQVLQPEALMAILGQRACNPGMPRDINQNRWVATQI